MSGVSERANGRASGPVLQSVFLAVIDHSAAATFFETAFDGTALVQPVAVEIARAVDHEIPAKLEILVLQLPQRWRRGREVFLDGLILQGDVASES